MSGQCQLKPKVIDHRLTVFLRLTSRSVDPGCAKLGEILLPATHLRALTAKV